MKGKVLSECRFGGPRGRNQGENAGRSCWSPGRGHRKASQVSRAASETGSRSGVLEIAPGKYFCPSECSDDIINSRHLLCIYLCQAACFAHTVPVNPQGRKAPLQMGKLSLRKPRYLAKIHRWQVAELGSCAQIYQTWEPRGACWWDRQDMFSEVVAQRMQRGGPGYPQDQRISHGCVPSVACMVC